MAGADLNELIDGWLGTPGRLRLSFPPALEARYEADTGPARSRMLMWFGLCGFAFATCIYVVLRDSMPDVAVRTRQLYLGISMPLGFLISASMRLNPSPFLREGLTLLANMVCACISMYLGAISQTNTTSLFVAGVTILMVYSAVGIQLRFRFAACAMLIILLVYGLALRARPDLTETSGRTLLVMAACTAIYLLLANWRLEREGRRSYLVNLRETLRGQDLSRRNLELDALARRDPLTGLANRRAYDAWLSSEWTQQATRRGQLGLVVIDVDRFKAYNDFYGHAAGDLCLQKIALCLRDQLRGTTDLVARLGGEEFAILLPALPEGVCADVAERMRLAVQRLELPHSGIGPHGLVTISAGVASHVILPGASPATLFEAADSALYEAKLQGRNRVCVATIVSSALPANAAD